VVKKVKRNTLIMKVFPALIIFFLWLDGWFYPLLLLPFLYVIFVDCIASHSILNGAALIVKPNNGLRIVHNLLFILFFCGVAQNEAGPFT